MGECGLRGGYCELLNFDPAVKAMLFKMISAKLCSTVHGQVGNVTGRVAASGSVTGEDVSPPGEGLGRTAEYMTDVGGPRGRIFTAVDYN